MLYPDYTKKLLGLKDVIITGVEQKEKICFINLKMPRKLHTCPSCGNETDQIHDYRFQKVKDISAYGKFTILNLRKRRYLCHLCGKLFY
jgi:transposase